MFDPNERITATDAKKHAFFKEFKNDSTFIDMISKLGNNTSENHSTSNHSTSINTDL